MEKKRIAVIFGGCSAEYDISLQSAYSVITNMNPEKYETILIGITRDGSWVHYYGDIEKIPANIWHVDKDHCVPVVISPDRYVHKIVEFGKAGIKETGIDIAFPILHGKNGEDGTIQGLIELAGIPLAGCGTLASALCMDKDRAHKLVEQAGIKTPASVVFSQDFLTN
jgi:D-alanine---D-serine ligase